MKDRLKEIKHRKYEIVEELKLLKKELLELKEEENIILNERKIQNTKQKRKNHDRFN